MGRHWNHLIYRPQIKKRDNYKCIKCGTPEEGFIIDSMGNRVIQSSLIVDHIIPISLGGDEFDLDNMQTLCIKCNKIKNGKDQSEIARRKREGKK